MGGDVVRSGDALQLVEEVTHRVALELREITLLTLERNGYKWKIKYLFGNGREEKESQADVSRPYSSVLLPDILSASSCLFRVETYNSERHFA